MSTTEAIKKEEPVVNEEENTEETPKKKNKIYISMYLFDESPIV